VLAGLDEMHWQRVSHFTTHTEIQVLCLLALASFTAQKGQILTLRTPHTTHPEIQVLFFLASLVQKYKY